MAVLGNAIGIDLPNGDSVLFTDEKASHYLGKTTSELTDGSTTNPIVINSNNVTAVAYDWVVVGTANSIFQFDGTNWTAIAKGAVVNDSTITITTTGEADQTFSTNQASASTINIPVPVKGIQVNGVDLTPDSSTHKVDITVPTGPMTMKGTLGAAADDPTITALPVDGSADVGDTYKVITDGTYNSQVSKVGDVFTCLTKTTSPAANTWLWIPSGDDVDVTAVGAQNGLITNVGTNDDIVSTGKIGLNLKSTTLGSTAVPAVASSGRHFPVSLDSAGQVEVIVSAGELSNVVSDVTASNTVVTGIAADSATTQPAGAITGMYSYDSTNKKLKLNWLKDTTDSTAVFKPTTP